MVRRTSAEFALLLACCRWPRSSDARRQVVERSAGVDWPRFARLAARHRVEGLAWKALVGAEVEPPQPVRTFLATAAAGIAHQNLRFAAEAIRLRRCFDQAGLPLLFVKGISLSQLVYGDIGSKSGWDIDLLVAPEKVNEAAAILVASGYTLRTPDRSRGQVDLSLWHRRAKESVWSGADGSSWVELHTALTDDPMLLPRVGMSSPRRDVQISPSQFLPTLESDELFAYLCVHGASSAWFRLKWIADLAALIASETDREILRLYRRANELGAGRAPAQALLLADALFGLPLSEGLRRELRSDRTNLLLVVIALRKLTGRTAEVELDRALLGTASIHLAQLGLLPSWRYKASALRRMLGSSVHQTRNLPQAVLGWFDPLLRMVGRPRGQSPG